MKSTESTDQWAEWFNDRSSTSQNTVLHGSSSSPQRYSSQSTVHQQTDITSNLTDPRQSDTTDTIHIATLPHYVDLNDDLNQQQQQQQHEDGNGTNRSGWRWSTWSAANSWITAKNRNSTNTSTQGTSSKPPVPPTTKRTHHWLDRHKRRTFPPSARRVLKLEQKRLTHGSAMKKKHRFGGSSQRKQQKQRDKLFHHRLRRRHSLSGILTSFVQTPSSAGIGVGSTPPPLSSSSSHGGSPASNSGGGHYSSGNNSSSGGGGHSSSSSGLFRRGGLPFFSSHAPSHHSSRKSTTKATPTVRSSMVLQFTDDDDNDGADISSMHIPDVFYLDNNNSDNDDADDDESPHCSGTTGTLDKSISSRQQQKQRLQHPQQGSSQENGNWFSNWIMHHPRRKQKHSQKQTPKWLRGNQSIVLASNSNNVSHSKIHPSPTPPSTTTTTTNTTGNTNSIPHMLASTDGDNDGNGGGDNDEKAGTKSKHTTGKNKKKRTLPLIRYATLSDLSSLSSSNPSYYLMKSSATVESTNLAPDVGGGGNKKHRRSLLPLYDPLTITKNPTATRQLPSSYRFSAFWHSHSGKTGKQVIHVDEQGQAGHATLWNSWETCDHETAGNILASLFIFGFLICPCWWLGTVLYLARTSRFDTDLQSVYLWTPRTFGHLNCWMAAVSLLLIGLMGALAIWYHLSTV